MHFQMCQLRTVSVSGMPSSLFHRLPVAKDFTAVSSPPSHLVTITVSRHRFYLLSASIAPSSPSPRHHATEARTSRLPTTCEQGNSGKLSHPDNNLSLRLRT